MVQTKLTGGAATHAAKKYPEECITKAGSGKLEARVLEEMGEYVRYGYVDAETGRKIGKYALLLKNDKGEYDHMMIVPTKDGKEYVVYHKKGGTKKLYDEKKDDVVEF